MSKWCNSSVMVKFELTKSYWNLEEERMDEHMDRLTKCDYYGTPTNLQCPNHYGLYFKQVQKSSVFPHFCI